MFLLQLQASKKSSSSEDPTKPSQDLVVSNGGLRKGFSSTPDLKSTTEVPLIPLEELKIKIGVKTNVSKTDLDLSQPHHMQDDGKVGDQRGYFTLPGRRSKKLPPPDHAPPPPPPPPLSILKESQPYTMAFMASVRTHKYKIHAHAQVSTSLLRCNFECFLPR